MDTGISRILILSLVLFGCDNKKVSVQDDRIDVQLEEPDDFDFDVEYGRKPKDEKPTKKNLAGSLKSVKRVRKPKLVLRKPIKPVELKYNGNKVDLSVSNDIVAPCDARVEKVEVVGNTQTIVLATKSDPNLHISLSGIAAANVVQGQDVKSGDILGNGNSVSMGFEKSNSTSIIANDDIKFTS